MAPPSDIPRTSTKRPHEDGLLAAQEQLLREPVSSDLTIKCGERTWKCQSAILSQRCDFFRIACTGQYKESKTRVFTLDADDEAAVDMLLLYLYTLEIPVAFKPQKGSFDDAENAYVIGDKYQVQSLKLAGYNYMIASITQMLVVSKIRQDSAAVKDWTGFIMKLWVKDYPDAEHFKGIILGKLVKASKYFYEDDTFKKFLDDNLDFNRDFISALVRYVSGMH